MRRPAWRCLFRHRWAVVAERRYLVPLESGNGYRELVGVEYVQCARCGRRWQRGIYRAVKSWETTGHLPDDAVRRTS